MTSVYWLDMYSDDYGPGRRSGVHGHEIYVVEFIGLIYVVVFLRLIYVVEFLVLICSRVR